VREGLRLGPLVRARVRTYTARRWRRNNYT
jgi:hypothetical protein